MSDGLAFMIGLGFFIALMVVSAYAAFGQSDTEGGWVKDGYTNDPTVLCVNGHPAPRRPFVAYGGLPTKACCERDHICPLGLGCPDTIDNLQYQPWPEARVKDGLERYAEEAYCRDPSPELLDQMRRSFSREYPRP